MAEKKIVSAKDAKNKDYSKAKTKDTSNLRKENRKKNALPLRIPAVILWVVAIGFEIAAFFMLKAYTTDPASTGLGMSTSTLLIIFLVIDAVCAVVGSLLWKKANRISPCTSDSKFVCFLWNQMGVIACLLAFIPFGIFFLANSKDLSPKMKSVVGFLTLALVIVAAVSSIDFDPPTGDSVTQSEIESSAAGEFDGTVYWTRYGSSYHLDPECQTLTRSDILIEGTLEEAQEAGITDPCDFCAGGDLAKEAEANAADDTADDQSVDDAVDDILDGMLDDDAA